MKEIDFMSLIKKGIITEEEYRKFISDKNVNNGEITGGYRNTESIVRKYKFNGNLLDGSLVDFIRYNIVPPLGAESYDKVFKIYGYSYYGICDGYEWFTKDNITDTAIKNGYKPLEEATELELWKIIAICSRYWKVFYERCYRDLEEKYKDD